MHPQWTTCCEWFQSAPLARWLPAAAAAVSPLSRSPSPLFEAAFCHCRHCLSTSFPSRLTSCHCEQEIHPKTVIPSFICKNRSMALSKGLAQGPFRGGGGGSYLKLLSSMLMLQRNSISLPPLKETFLWKSKPKQKKLKKTIYSRQTNNNATRGDSAAM